MASVHSSINKYCRVCRGLLQKKKKQTQYSCAIHSEKLKETFGIDTSCDSDIHPTHFCNTCYSVVRRQITASREGIPYRHSMVTFQWQAHTEENYMVSSNVYDIVIVSSYQLCEHIQSISQSRGGGWNKKATKNRGRPQDQTSIPAIIRHLRAIAPPPISPSKGECTYAQSLTCPLCLELLHQPIEMSCGSLVCLSCCCRWLQVSGKMDCPCCHHHQMNREEVKCPSQFIINLLSEMKENAATNHEIHGDCSWESCYHHVTVKDILNTPTNTPTDPVEREVAQHLVRRIMVESEDKVIRLPTKGTVSIV